MQKTVQKTMQKIREKPNLLHFLVLFLVIFIIFIGPAHRIWQVCVASFSGLATNMIDDSFYYFGPAWNFKEYGFFTTDGLSRMYGFQPLWMVIITPLAYLFNDKEAFLRGILILSSLIYGLSGVCLFKFFNRKNTNHVQSVITASLIGTLWTNWYMVRIFTDGKENALQVLLLALLILICTKKSGRNKSLLLGLTCGLLVLTRTNALVLPAMLYAFWLVMIIMKRKGIKQFITSAASAALPVIIWSVYAAIAMGSAFPVSGSRKLGMIRYIDYTTLYRHLYIFKDIFQVFKHTTEKIPFFTILALAITASIIIGTSAIMILKRKKEHSSPFENLKTALLENPLLTFAITAISIYALVNYILTSLLLTRWFSFGFWYHAPEYFVEMLVMLTLSGFFVKRLDVITGLRVTTFNIKRSVVPAVMCAFLAIFVIVPTYVRMTGPLFVWSDPFLNEIVDSKEWIEKNIQKGSKIACFDSGFLAYFLDDYTVINLDGLSNSYEYTKNLNRNPAYVDTYLTEMEVQYLISFGDMNEIKNRSDYRGIKSNRIKAMNYIGERPLWSENMRFFITELN